MKRATIKDVARIADVSIATVSRVVNGISSVNQEIRERVDQAIAETGYVPDTNARSMKNKTTYLIGFIVSDISNQHLMSIARAIEIEIAAKNYSLLVCSTENDPRIEKGYLNALISRNVSGIVLHSTGKIDAEVAKISREIPMTLVYRRNLHPRFSGDLVDTNGEKGARELAQFLLARGHHRIGIVNGLAQFSTGRDRYRGFTNAMAGAGFKSDPNLVVEGDFTESSGFHGAAALMSHAPPPSAIIGMNNAVAIGILKFLKHAGLRVPEDVSVACYGEINDVELMQINPTRVPQDPWSLGTKAGQLLLDRIANPDRPNREAVFEAGLIIGDSVAAPKRISPGRPHDFPL